MSYRYVLNADGFGIPISQSQSLWYGKNCDHVLGSLHSLNPEVVILKDQIRIEGQHDYTKVIISDLAGKTFLEEDIMGIKTIRHSFEKNIVYLLTFVSDEKIVTKKFLIK